MSVYWVNGMRHNLTDEDVLAALEKAAGELNYSQESDISLKCIDTHSLQEGGANVMSLASYTGC